jgi:hypothetical protein
VSADATTPAEWLTAIGTVGAVVVALGLAIVPAFLKWLARPRLQVIVGQQEPHLRVVLESEDVVVGQRVRLEIGNCGRREAEKVQVFLRNWWVKTTDESKWINFDIDPIPLAWVNPAVSTPMFTAGLPGDSSSYVELAHDRLDYDTDGGWIIHVLGPATSLTDTGAGGAEWSTRVDTQKDEYQGKGVVARIEFWAEVVVTSTNAEPLVQHVHLVWPYKGLFTVALNRPPKPIIVEHRRTTVANLRELERARQAAHP